MMMLMRLRTQRLRNLFSTTRSYDTTIVDAEFAESFTGRAISSGGFIKTFIFQIPTPR